jgi:hypothetical protein
VKAYEVIVVRNPTKKAADEEGAVPEVIMDQRTIMARDERMALLKVGSMLGPQAQEDNRLEVQIRPF